MNDVIMHISDLYTLYVILRIQIVYCTMFMNI